MLVPPKTSQGQTKPVMTPNSQLPKKMDNIPSQKQSSKKVDVDQAAAKAVKMAQDKMAQAKQVASNKMKSGMPLNGIKQATNVLRSYAMVVSSFENVSRNSEISSDIAEQLGKTIDVRLGELNRQAQRAIEDLPEYKNLEIDSIKDLGEELADMMTDQDDQLKAFALLKSPEFAGLMDSSDKAHRSFADMMQDNGEEKLLFGAIQASAMMNPRSSAHDVKAVSIKA